MQVVRTTRPADSLTTALESESENGADDSTPKVRRRVIPASQGTRFRCRSGPDRIAKASTEFAVCRGADAWILLPLAEPDIAALWWTRHGTKTQGAFVRTRHVRPGENSVSFNAKPTPACDAIS